MQAGICITHEVCTLHHIPDWQITGPDKFAAIDQADFSNPSDAWLLYAVSYKFIIVGAGYFCWALSHFRKCPIKNAGLQLINLIETFNSNYRFIINKTLPKFLSEYFKPIRANFNFMPSNRIQTGPPSGPFMGVST
jgi:hypothetical protein